MAAQRRAKIEQYRQRKELEARLSDVRKVIDGGQADEEVTRDFYLLNIRRWVTVCLEEIESINQEMEILQKMVVLKQSETRQPTRPVRPPMKPFILTKDAVQVRTVTSSCSTFTFSDKRRWLSEVRRQRKADLVLFVTRRLRCSEPVTPASPP